MKRIEKKISGFLPMPLKVLIASFLLKIRHIYRWFTPNRPSAVKIDKLTDFEVAYRKGTVDESIINISFEHDVFFPAIPEYHVADNHVIIDVGAHIGTFSLLAASKVPRGKVHAIEASEDSFNLLRINIALNRAANIFPYHLALGDKQGTLRLYHARDNWGHTVVSRVSRNYETVTACTLSDFLESNNIDKCHLMKLNCEGAEFPILLSTPPSVLKRFDTILALYHCDLWKENTESDLISYLQSSGFNTVVRHKTKKRGWIIATNDAP